MVSANIQKHNFKSNYLAATGANDAALQKDILINEIADLIAKQPQDVVSAIETTGFNYKGDSYRDLTEATLQLLQTSEKFRTMIAVLIHQRNGLVTDEQIMQIPPKNTKVYPTAGYGGTSFVRDTGGFSKKFGPQYMGVAFIGDIFQGIGNTAVGVGNAVASGLNLKAAKATADANLAAAKLAGASAIEVEQEKTKQSMLAAVAAKLGASGPASGGSSTALIVVMVLALGTAAVAVGYVFTRKAPVAPMAVA